MNEVDWTTEHIEELRRRLLTWREEKDRSYPWRLTQDPYAIIAAEFMLHRTQAVQAERVYREFMVLWPTLADVVQANEEGLRQVLQPLGLQWRIELMLKAFKHMWEKHGQVPTQLEELLATPGVGPYIAAATVCFARNVALPLVDTNTVRVTGRVSGLDISGEARRRKDVIRTIGEACDPERPREYYYRMIDLAHDICHVRAPECGKCPLLEVPCFYSLQLRETGNSD